MSKQLGHLLVRADAGIELGTGHVMRCLALAQAWQARGGTATFAMAAGVPAVAVRLAAEGMDCVDLDTAAGTEDDARATARRAHECAAAWVLLDGYAFDGAYQRALHESGLKLLVVDDNGEAGEYWADVVLNPNWHAGQDNYAARYARRAASTRLLLGTRYTPLRREFWPWRDWKREPRPAARRVLVTMGGSDPAQWTVGIVDALGVLGHALDVVVATGGSNPRAEDIQAAAARARLRPWMQLRVEQDVTDMARWMEWADLALTAAGSTCWELMFMQLPMAIVPVSDNQRASAAALLSGGFAVPLARDPVGRVNLDALQALLADDARRRELGARGREKIDGWGVARVMRALASEEDHERPA